MIMPSVVKMSKTYLSNKLLKADVPYFLGIKVTYRCNSRCKFCVIWKNQKESMETADIINIIDQAADLGVLHVTLDGGEPLLRDDIGVIAKEANKKGLIVYMTTNGTLLKQKAREVIPYIDLLSVSFDTVSREKYKDLRGIDAFPLVCEGVKEAVEISKDYPTKIVASTVLTSKNIDEIEDIIKFTVEEMGFHGVIFQPVDVFSKESEYLDVFKDKERLVRALNVIRKYKKMGYPIMNTYEYLGMVEKNQFEYKCNPSNCMQVSSEGDMCLPCMRIPNKKICLKTNGLKKAWEEGAGVRKSLHGCNKCRYHCIIESNLLLSRFNLMPLKILGEWIDVYSKTNKWKKPLTRERKK
jgi:MoaA/NifB/PqqE/SkfB family radical SAM enzyme